MKRFARSWVGQRREFEMLPIKDIKILLFAGYAFGYPLAVLAPALIDPLLKSHPTFPLRHYPYVNWCFLIYMLLLGTQFFLLRSATKLLPLYLSVCLFITAILVSLPIFLPEFPHANLVAVGVTTGFFTAFSIFIWSVARELSIESRPLRSAGNATLEYLKVLFTFLRQAAFACVTLFGALFLAAYATGFKFADATVTDPSDKFLLYVNIGFQVSFYAVYAIAGPIRYFFVMNIRVLSQLKETSFLVDRKRGKTKGKRPSVIARAPRKDDVTDDEDD